MADFINTIDVLGDDAVIDSIIDRSIVEFADDKLTTVGYAAFKGCTQLESVKLPNVTSFGEGAFNGCSSLSSVDMPNATSIGGGAFDNCSSLREVTLPAGLTAIWGNNTFANCSSMKYVRIFGFTALPGNSQFANCSELVAVVLYMEKFCQLHNSPSFSNTPIAAGTGYIYVPSALLETYKTATNWSAFGTQFRAIEDYTVDGTITGEFPRCTGVALDKTTLTFEGWESQTLTATCENLSPLGIDTVIWSSTDPSVATVNNGVVRPGSKGTTTITATCNGHSASCEVTVNAEGPAVIYSLDEPKTFNGSSDYIDTGIKLFDTAKDFTIICEAEFSKLADQNKCLFHCMNEATPWPGISIDGSSGVRICYTGSSSITTSISNRNDVSALAIRYVDGKMNAIRYRNASGNIVTHAVSGTPTYTKVTQNLLLGAYQEVSGTKGRFFNGTISRFNVYPTALSDEEIEAFL